MTALNRASIDARVGRHFRDEMEDDELWRIRS